MKAATLDIRAIALDEIVRDLRKLRFGHRKLTAIPERQKHDRTLELRQGDGTPACTVLMRAHSDATVFVGVVAPGDRECPNYRCIPLDDPKFFDKIVAFVKTTVGGMT